MKKHMEFIVQFKFVWSMFFTAFIIIYSMVNMLLGQESMTFITIWQFVFLTVILTLIYYLAFGDLALKGLQQKYKVLIHFFLSYSVLLLAVYWFGWFEISNGYLLGLFTLGCIILYLSISFSLYVYYKSTGEQLNNKLALYKAQKNKGASK